jgi:defect in organelle trafficking protein DotC
MKHQAMRAAVALAVAALAQGAFAQSWTGGSSGAALPQSQSNGASASQQLVPASYAFGTLNDPSWAQPTQKTAGEGPVPPSLDSITSANVRSNDELTSVAGVPPIRAEAIQEAAAGLGARAGLASRTDEYARSIKGREGEFDQLFNFKALMLDIDRDATPDTPPFFNRSAADHQERRAYLVPAVLTNGGPADSYPSDSELRLADRIYKIEAKAYLSPVPPNWRNYLNLSYTQVQMPNASLLPKTDAEKALWDKWVKLGWQRGYDQADQMFSANFSRLVRDFDGMENFRIAYDQGLISRPRVARANLGVTGGGNEMRLGDSIRRITDQSALNPNVSKWLTLDPAP